jgi:hypothetical protein
LAACSSDAEIRERYEKLALEFLSKANEVAEAGRDDAFLIMEDAFPSGMDIRQQ